MGRLLEIAFFVALAVSVWRLFVKTGRPGWYGFVPLWNLLCLLRITGKPAWWMVLFILPGVNVIAALFLGAALSRSFGHSGWLVLLGPIFVPYLGLSDARYLGPRR